MDEIVKPVGVFSASRISELVAGGTGRTRRNYILDLAMEICGIKKSVKTMAMDHGTQNQQSAFELFKKYFWADYPNARWFDEYIPINDNCGASPDVMLDDVTTFDIKCPYTEDNFLDQVQKVPNKYFWQIQMQLLATGGDMCGIGFYLTKPEFADNNEEYAYSIKDRLHPVMFPQSAEHQDTIQAAVELAVPERDLYVDIIGSAEILDPVQYFYEQKKHHRYRDLKDCGNIAKAEVVRVENRLYYLSK